MTPSHLGIQKEVDRNALAGLELHTSIKHRPKESKIIYKGILPQKASKRISWQTMPYHLQAFQRQHFCFLLCLDNCSRQFKQTTILKD